MVHWVTCPARGKGGPAEAPGKDQRGKSSKGRVANLANKGPVAEESIEEEDGVKVALQNMTATRPEGVRSSPHGRGRVGGGTCASSPGHRITCYNCLLRISSRSKCQEETPESVSRCLEKGDGETFGDNTIGPAQLWGWAAPSCEAGADYHLQTRA